MNASNEFNKEKLLGKSFVFEALDSRAREELAEFSYVKRYDAGQKIFAMGEPGMSMMAIAEGSVRVSMMTPGDRDITLNDLQAGDVFGEIAMLDGGGRSANVDALTNCALVVLERRSFLDVLNRNPALSIRLIELLCQRVRRSDERMIEVAFMDTQVRLSKLLLRLTTTTPGSNDRPLQKLSQSQSELAGMIGNTRESVNRCLGKWQKADLIVLRDGWLIIKDRERLEALADEF